MDSFKKTIPSIAPNSVMLTHIHPYLFVGRIYQFPKGGDNVTTLLLSCLL